MARDPEIWRMTGRSGGIARSGPTAPADKPDQPREAEEHRARLRHGRDVDVEDQVAARALAPAIDQRTAIVGVSGPVAVRDAVLPAAHRLASVMSPYSTPAVTGCGVSKAKVT